MNLQTRPSRLSVLGSWAEVVSLRSAERNSDFRKYFIYSNYNVPINEGEHRLRTRGAIFFLTAPRCPRIEVGAYLRGEAPLRTRMQSKKAQLLEAGAQEQVIQPKIRNKSDAPVGAINHHGSVHKKFYSSD